MRCLNVLANSNFLQIPKDYLKTMLEQAFPPTLEKFTQMTKLMRNAAQKLEKTNHLHVRFTMNTHESETYGIHCEAIDNLW